MVEDRSRKGLPGVTGILAERAQKRIELEVFGNIEDVLEKCRAHLLNAFQKGKEVNVEYELSEYILRQIPDLNGSMRREVVLRLKNELTGYGVIQGLMDDTGVTI